MHRTIEVVIEADGRIRLLEPVEPGSVRRALLTILEEQVEEPTHAPALLSEPALDDWNRPEEDEAWSHLQSAR